MKHFFSLHTLAHGLAFAFAAGSFANIRHYLAGAGHGHEAAIIIGGSLGLSLVVSSVMLARTDRDASPKSFWSILAVGIGFGLVSGWLQTAEYAKHLAQPAAAILGYGIPLLGEVGLSLAVNEYTKGQDRERFRSVSQTIERAVADQLEAAVAEFDPTPIRRHVDRTLITLSRAAVDSVSAQAIQFYQSAPSTEPTTPSFIEHSTETPSIQTDQPARTIEQAGNVQNSDPNTDQNNLDTVNAKRKADKQAAQAAMLDIYRTEPFASYRSVGHRIGRSASTVSDWLDELEAGGVVHRNGNGVEVRS
jgi:hypothetical protein